MDSGFYNMDCMEAMKQFPDGFFDLAIVDPPYGIRADKFNNGAGYKRKKDGSTAKRLRADGTWDATPPPPEYFAELRRVSQNQIIWGGNYFDLPPTRGIVVWDKVQPWENFSQVELAWTSFDKPAALFRYSNCSGANRDHKGKIHPTQKPVALYEWLLKKYAKPGFKILDTHVGSASSLIACHRAGLEYWGFEINPAYYEAATERLRKEMAQVTIFDMKG